MKYYFAPLEGITNYRYRKIHNKYFNGIDKYFIPFLKPNQKGIIKKDLKDMDPKNNDLSVKVVPQIISKNIDDTLYLMNKLETLGYDEININLGCPSATVVSKGKGGGMLKNLDYLDTYLFNIYSYNSLKISLKIRIGIEDENEFLNIIKVINKYPVYELIIHPRTVKDLYNGPLHLSLLDNIDKLTNINIIYNGDIKSIKDINYITNRYPFLNGVMIGRGLITTPDLLDYDHLSDIEKINRLKNFYLELKEANLKELGFNNDKFYEAEVWSMMFDYINVDDKIRKSLFRCKDVQEKEKIINKIFSTCTLNKEILGIKKYI